MNAVRGSPPVRARAGRRNADGAAYRQLAAPHPQSPSIGRASAGARERSEWDRGLELLLAFLGATVIMVVAVALVGAVDAWWVLVPVMLVHLIVTFGVIATIVHLLGDTS